MISKFQGTSKVHPKILINICFFYQIISKITSFEFINFLAYYHYLLLFGIQFQVTLTCKPSCNIQKSLQLPIKTISSAKRRQFIISEAKLTPKFCSDSILTKSIVKTENRVGYRTHPCFSPNSWSNQSDSKSPKRTLLLTLYYNTEI